MLGELKSKVQFFSFALRVLPVCLFVRLYCTRSQL